MRLYELFMGPLDQVKPWQMSGVEGVYRFLQRVWRLVVDERSRRARRAPQRRRAESEPQLQRVLHATIKKVLEDTEALRFNTAIAQMMIFVNEATGSCDAAAADRPEVSARPRPVCAACRRGAVGASRGRRPHRPHPWPSHDPALCEQATIDLAVQVNGKRRDVINVPRDADQQLIERLAVASEGAVRRSTDGRRGKSSSCRADW
jgi:leucyl-tRNA synthetase